MYRETTSGILAPVQGKVLRPVSESAHLLVAPCMWDESALHGLEWAHSSDDNTEDELPHGTVAEMRLSPRGRDGKTQADAVGPTCINETPSTMHTPSPCPRTPQDT